MKKNTKGGELGFGDYLRHKKLYFDSNLFEKYDYIDYMSKHFSMEKLIEFNNIESEMKQNDCDCGCCWDCDGSKSSINDF